MKSTIHGFSKPNVFALSSLGSPPALAWDIGRLWINAGLAGLHVAEDLHSINGAALVRINPVFTCRETKRYFPHIFPVLYQDRSHPSHMSPAQTCLRGKLTALPVGVAELQVSAGPGRALLRAVGTADVLHLVVQGFQSGIHLCIMLVVTFGGLVCPHVPQGVRTLLRMRQTSESRHVDAGSRGARKTGGTRIPWGALRRGRV